MNTKKQIDYKEVMQYKLDHPKASYKAIADVFKCNRSTIYRILTQGSDEMDTDKKQAETSDNAPMVSTEPFEETPPAFEKICPGCGGKLMKSWYNDEETGEKKECWYCIGCGDIYED